MHMGERPGRMRRVGVVAAVIVLGALSACSGSSGGDESTPPTATLEPPTPTPAAQPVAQRFARQHSDDATVTPLDTAGCDPGQGRGPLKLWQPCQPFKLGHDLGSVGAIAHGSPNALNHGRQHVTAGAMLPHRRRLAWRTLWPLGRGVL